MRNCHCVELRALCNEVPRTPPGPEGSNGTGNASCAADHPKFLFSSFVATKMRHVVPPVGVIPANELPGYSPQVAPAEIQRSSWTGTRHGNGCECDQERSRGACLHFLRRGGRW